MNDEQVNDELDDDFLDRGLLAEQLGEMGFESDFVMAEAAEFCFRLIEDSPENDQDPEDVLINHTRLGGQPEVPPDFQWPLRNGQPLAFLGQVELPEEDHLLSFFYDASETPLGIGPKDIDSCQVLRLPLANLQPCSPPSNLDPAYHFPEKKVGITGDANLPDSKSIFYHFVDVGEKDLNLLRQLEIDSEKTSSPCHHLLGHPALLQSDMEVQCELMHQGKNATDLTHVKDDEMEDLLEESSDWMLLAQFDSDPGLNWNWIDGGRLFFWIRGEDIQNDNFENVICIPQFEINEE